MLPSPYETIEARHSELALWHNPGEWDGEGDGRGTQDGGAHVHLWLIHAGVWEKNTIIL